MMSPAQCKAARAGLDISVRDLAKSADVSTNTITRYENGAPEMRSRTIKAMQDALEDAGATFLDDLGDGTGPGVRLRPISTTTPEDAA